MRMKLLMEWDILPGHDGQYLEFVVGEFAPAVMRMGLQIVDAWYTLHGNRPQILVAGVTPDKETLDRILHSQEWENLLTELHKYIHNYQQKIVPDRGRFQM